VYAAEGAAVTRLAFSACFWTETVTANPEAAKLFWSDVRDVCSFHYSNILFCIGRVNWTLHVFLRYAYRHSISLSRIS
jgi:hypothetical protein